jgi:hypothetical protein
MTASLARGWSGTRMRASGELGAKKFCALGSIVDSIRLQQADGGGGCEPATYCRFNLPQLRMKNAKATRLC